MASQRQRADAHEVPAHQRDQGIVFVLKAFEIDRHGKRLCSAKMFGWFMALGGFVYTDNVDRHNLYGFFGSGVGTGKPALEKFFKDPVMLKNVWAGMTGYSYPAT